MAMLDRLIYRSRATQEFGSLALFHLLTQAQLRNEKLKVTGHLLYFKDHFTQCIEGPASSIELLWQELMRDTRHQDLELIARHTASERRFAQWSMAFSTYSAFYVHGMRGFFPMNELGQSPLVNLCSSAP